MLDGRNFRIYADQKMLVYAFRQKPNKCSPHQLRHLDYIFQYSTDILHVQGSQNVVPAALSRTEIDSITNCDVLNFTDFTEARKNDPEIQNILLKKSSSLQLEFKPC